MHATARPGARRPALLRPGRLLCAGIFAVSFAVAAALSAQPATLVKDINPGSGPKPGSSFFSPHQLVSSGTYVYFDADTGGGGAELWRTDGTAAGTVMVADIGADDPYHPGSDPTFLTDVNGTLFFEASGLWKTDGTTAGTVLLDSSGQILAVHDFGGTLVYFKYAPGTQTVELWKTDGTPGGTVLVKGGFVYNFGSNMYTPAPAHANGLLFFNVDDGVAGVELWKSDGTPGGTALVKDIWPGPTGSNPTQLTAVGTSVFFSACEPTAGCELWKSDGSPGGTLLVKDIAPGAQSSYVGSLVASGGLLVFGANDGISGTELWVSDGSGDGTNLLRDIHAGPGSSFPSQLTPGPGGVYFRADDGIAGGEPWKTDGTPGGTIRLADLNAGAGSSYPENFAVLGSNVYFSAFDSQRGWELWKTDGTPGGTTPVRDVAVRTNIAVLSGSLIFVGTDASPFSADFWKSDGTTGGTSRFFSFDAPSSSSPSPLAASGTDLFFTATTPADGPQVFRTGGTGPGTSQLTSIEHAYWNPFYEMKTVAGKTFFTSDGYLWVTPGEATTVERLTPVGASTLGSLGGLLLFFLNGPSPGLWKSDGTIAGTQMLHTYPYGVTPPVAVGSVAYFISGSGSTAGELWKTDGTPDGTLLVLELPTFSTFSNLTAFNGLFYFVLTEGINTAIWRSDGTGAGTYPLIPLPGNNLTVVGGTLFFTAVHPMTGEELWKTDGTFSGTRLVKDIRPGPDSSSPQQLVAIGSELFFVATDDVHGAELWKSDGTENGTSMVAEIRPGTTSSDIQNMTASGGLLYFTASDFSTGVELWKSDGSPGGTSIVRDIYPGPASSSPGSLLDVGGVLYFAATDPVAGRELWKTDGTPGGTMLVRDIDPSLNDSSPSGGVEVGGLLYFAARSETTGTELWRSDGTAGGTTLVKDLIPGPSSGNPSSIASVGGRFFFQGADEVLGSELWSSDGTPAGTALVKDIRPGSASSVPTGFTPFGGRVYFSADDGVHGRELWVTDGTSSGTRLFADLSPGPSPSYPADLRVVGPYLYFAAGQPSSLWRTDGTVAGTIQLSSPVYAAPAALGGSVYFLRSPTYPESELWRTDGTVAGTSLVATLPVYGYELVRSGAFLYLWAFAADTLEVWRTDGTAPGTVPLRGGFAQDYVPQFTDVNGTLFFVADDKVHGRELWKSTGTPASTVLVSDIWPGLPGSQPAALINVGGALVFRANDGSHGSELWVSDGTAPGTHLLQDIQPGVASSRPGFNSTADWAAIAGTRVFFPATDSSTGNELWSMPMSAVCSPPAAPTITSSRNPSCGDVVMLDAGPGYASYLWSTGETTRTILVSPGVTTIYTAIVANATGCRSSSTIVQTVDPALIPAAPPVSNNGPICAGQTLQLSAGTVPGAAYFWTGPDGFTSMAQNPQILSAPASASGAYQLIVVVNGCSSPPASTVVVVNPTPSAQIAVSSAVCANSVGNPASVPSAGAGATYAWTIGNGTITSGAGTNAITYTAPASGTISLGVTVTGANGCSLQGGRSISVGATCGNDFFTLPPCRVVDTRVSDGPPLAAGADRTFLLAGKCGIPAGAAAVSLNVGVTATAMDGHLVLFPAGTAAPPTSAINYRAGQTRSNNAVVMLDAAGQITIRCNQAAGTTDVILDVNGYYDQ